MQVWWNGLTILQQAMFVVGSAALLFMIVQIIMMFVGIGAHDMSLDADASGVGDIDVGGDMDGGDVGSDVDGGDMDGGDGGDADGDAGGDGDTDGGSESETNGNHGPIGGEVAAIFIGMLSLRSILAFICFGSWVTFIFAEYDLAWYYALLIGVGVGLIAAFIMSLVMREIMKLQSNGSLKMKNCVGKEGEVYLTVPASRSGSGKINILVQEAFTEFDAVTDEGSPIPTGEKVKVVAVEGGTLVVKTIAPSVADLTE